MIAQQKELALIPHIIVCTPGRMIHHLLNDQANLVEYLKNLQFLVIDEADRLIMEEAFAKEVKVNYLSYKFIQKILQFVPEMRQTLLFSATMVQDFDKLISKEELFGNEQQAK